MNNINVSIELKKKIQYEITRNLSYELSQDFQELCSIDGSIDKYPIQSQMVIKSEIYFSEDEIYLFKELYNFYKIFFKDNTRFPHKFNCGSFEGIFPEKFDFESMRVVFSIDRRSKDTWKDWFIVYE